MTSLRWKLSLTFLVVSTCFIYAQNNFILKGKIVDKLRQPIAYAEVILQSKADTTSLWIDHTDEDGVYEISKVTRGDYVLQVSLVGYESYQAPMVMTSSTTHDVSLEESVAQIAQVIVVAKKPYIEKKIDRTIVNVDALISNAGSSAYEALERAPGVSSDENGNLKLKGRQGVSVYLDDKPLYLSGQELENYLRSLPTGTIKHIEIMPNPPAKYEAAGSAGVINIVTKRNRFAGMHGNLSMSEQRSRFWRSNNNGSINFNKNKWSLALNISKIHRKSYQDLNINRYYKDASNQLNSTFFQNSYIVKQSDNVSGKLGIDYYANEKTTIGMSVKALNSPGTNKTINHATLTTVNSPLQNSVFADNTENLGFSNQSYNAYLRQIIDTTGTSLTLDIDHLVYTSSNDQLYYNTFKNDLGDITYTDRIDGAIPASIKIYTAKSDFNRVINEQSSYALGIKSAYTKTNNKAIYATTIDGATTPDYNLSNSFLYDEYIHAAYVNYSTRLGGIDFQLGLRGEITSFKGHQLGNVIKKDSLFSRNYKNFFPTVYASWKMDTAGLHVLSFNYGRRIDRPYFQDLNPFVSPLDKFTFYTGNPGLLPTYSDNFSLTHGYKDMLYTSLGYSYTADGINETLEIIDGIYYSRPNNITSSHTYNIDVELNTSTSTWHTFNAYTQFAYFDYKSKLYTEQLQSGAPYFYISVNNTFTMGKGWSGDIRGDYQSDVVSAQLLIKSFGVVNLGIAKKILHDAATIKLAINDIFHTRRGSGVINNLRRADADWNSKIDTRLAALTFSWRFGKSTMKNNKYNAGSSQSEQQRVKG